MAKKKGIIQEPRTTYVNNVKYSLLKYAGINRFTQTKTNATYDSCQKFKMLMIKCQRLNKKTLSNRSILEGKVLKFTKI